MRYAVLSDIHANLEALTAVLEFLTSQRIDRYLCLGDVIGYGADPGACLERLQSLPAQIVAGNHEYGCVGKLSHDWFHQAARASLEWTRDQLGFGELDMLRRLALTQEEGPCTLAHASLRRPERFAYLVDAAGMVDTLAACRTSFCLIGHTHVPCVVAYASGARRLERFETDPSALGQVPVPQREGVRYLLNPGSVGQPRDGDLRASVGILDLEAQQWSVHRVSYDVAAAQRKIRAAGLPAILADRLSLGR